MGALTGPAVPLGEVVAIPVDEIEMGERLRPVDTTWADALGQIMLRDGQLTPIEVCKLPGRKKYTLVKGGHRLAAGQLFLDLSPMKAIIVSADSAERRMRELSDDFFRRDLHPLDRAAFIAELVTLQKLRDGIDPAKDGRAASANVRWQKAIQEEAEDATATIAVAYGWTEKVAEQIGISPRTVRDNLALYRRISPEVIDQLRRAKHPSLNNASELKALASYAEDKNGQQWLLGLILHANARYPAAPFPTIKAAIAAVKAEGKPVKTAEDKRHSAFIGAFSRMSLAEKKGALATLATMLPAGFKIEGIVA